MSTYSLCVSLSLYLGRSLSLLLVFFLIHVESSVHVYHAYISTRGSTTCMYFPPPKIYYKAVLHNLTQYTTQSLHNPTSTTLVILFVRFNSIPKSYIPSSPAHLVTSFFYIDWVSWEGRQEKVKAQLIEHRVY